MPAYDLMWEDIMEINQRSKHSPFHIRLPFVHMITSRGCPNACTFCAVKVAWGRLWIPRSAENVVDEIEYLSKIGFKEIHFNDDNCSINKDRMYNICELILSRKIDVKIVCPTGIHVATLERPLLKLMKKAGFYRLCFGIESGNSERQKLIKKNINLEKAKQVIRDANDLGYWTSATFIFDFPNETKEQVEDTMKFVRESGLDFPIFYNLIPQPKTEIYAELGLTV
jgi:anaerobic magnesium-protoporphyrin IX monomethyl ester cyclase